MRPQPVLPALARLSTSSLASAFMKPVPRVSLPCPTLPPQNCISSSPMASSPHLSRMTPAKITVINKEEEYDVAKWKGYTVVGHASLAPKKSGDPRISALEVQDANGERHWLHFVKHPVFDRRVLLGAARIFRWKANDRGPRWTTAPAENYALLIT